MRTMRNKLLLLPALVMALLMAVPPAHAAQVTFGVHIGAAPVCPYGYYDYSPYRCAPYGYYGPEWFSNGVFVGAGPWFHGPRNFYGHVDHSYDPRFGYRGGYPSHNEHFDTHRDFHEFHGGYQRDGHGHERGGDRGGDNYRGGDNRDRH